MASGKVLIENEDCVEELCELVVLLSCTRVADRGPVGMSWYGSIGVQRSCSALSGLEDEACAGCVEQVGIERVEAQSVVQMLGSSRAIKLYQDYLADPTLTLVQSTSCEHRRTYFASPRAPPPSVSKTER